MTSFLRILLCSTLIFHVFSVLGARNISSRCDSPITNTTDLNAPQAPTFEQSLQSGLDFLRDNGAGTSTAWKIRSVQANARHPNTGSRKATDFTKLAISLEDIIQTTVIITKNYATPRRVWAEPYRIPRPTDPMERFLMLFDWNDVVVDFKSAFEKVVTTGERGPWRHVQIVAHGLVRGGREPFYSFLPMREGVDPKWIGAVTGDVLSGFDGIGGFEWWRDGNGTLGWGDLGSDMGQVVEIAS